MVGLAIHTCGPALGLALSTFGGESRHQTWAFGRDLSMHLHPTLMAFIEPYTWRDFAFLAVAQGPGGFTGTRLGVVTARTLAQQLEIPLFGVSSLAAIAQSAVDQWPPEGSPRPIAVEMNAQRGQLFTAIYQATAAGLEPLYPDQVLTPEAWEAVLAQYPQPLDRIASEDGAATVVQVLELAHQRWQRGDRSPWPAVLPYYGQHPVDR